MVKTSMFYLKHLVILDMSKTSEFRIICNYDFLIESF